MRTEIRLLNAALFVNKHYWVIVSVIVVLAGGIMAFPPGYFSNLNVCIGLSLLPFSFFIAGKQRINYLYLSGLIVACGLVWLYPVKIFYFFALAFFILLAIEIHHGKLNGIVLFLIAFMSPFFEQVAGILGFPIRLHLSSLAGKFLTMAGMEIDVAGNMMTVDGNSFTVDDACMGLNMLSTSLLIGVLMIIAWYRKEKKFLSWYALTGYFSVIFILNLVCNVLRIITLVLFNIGPEHVLHGSVGLICFAAYSIVPAYFISQYAVRRFGVQALESDRTYRKTSLTQKIIVFGIAVILLWNGANFSSRKIQHQEAAIDTTAWDGFEMRVLEDGVTKLSDENVLIYIKPIAEFFSGEHTPLFCWKGGGYRFQQVKKCNVNGFEVYTGQMINHDGLLWTSWWYSNHHTQTIDQLDWRFRMMKGENKFYLINVTASDESTVLQYTTMLLQKENNHQTPTP